MRPAINLMHGEGNGGLGQITYLFLRRPVIVLGAEIEQTMIQTAQSTIPCDDDTVIQPRWKAIAA